MFLEIILMTLSSFSLKIQNQFIYSLQSESKSYKTKLSERYSHGELGNISIISQVMGMEC